MMHNQPLLSDNFSTATQLQNRMSEFPQAFVRQTAILCTEKA